MQGNNLFQLFRRHTRSDGSGVRESFFAYFTQQLNGGVAMRVERHRIGIWLLFAFAPSIQISYALESCESLKSLRLDRAEVVSAVMLQAAPLKTEARSLPLPPTTVPAHCEVRGVARPSSDSEIQFELWLPPAEVWNGKYLQHGNGGWAGGIPSSTLITPLARGYAAAATDDGHSTTARTPDASFAIGHPEKLIDFGY